MATKLDQMIAEVTLAYGRDGREGLVRKAADVAPQLTPKDVAKLPDRTYPKVSASKAGAPDQTLHWEHNWFEAVVELLYHRKQEGLLGLWLLATRETFSYPQYVLVRLFRLAADGLETETILERLHKLLEVQHIVLTLQTVREIVYWTQIDSRPLELLLPMSGIIVPNSDGDTVGTYIEQMKMELPVHLARMWEQRSVQ